MEKKKPWEKPGSVGGPVLLWPGYYCLFIVLIKTLNVLYFYFNIVAISRACHSICNALIKHLPVVIRRPTDAEVEEIGKGFERLSRHAAFRRAAGAIDDCHIRIRAPGKGLGQCYFNRKIFPSINLQAFCDPSTKFFEDLHARAGACSARACSV